ncbi:MAG: 16S rRNA (guanine(527)-N(7))-methyltransferase RsmG [Rhodobacteraceae bacterium]|nr:16S rRNA (guanine(527)-N(7))-methyltransferase RsmG [Paracoccaceae bacterium]
MDEVQLYDGHNVSRETYEKLRAYEALVQKWTRKINLISSSNIDDVWNRHIIDSTQLYPLMPDNTKLWADFGSGGGFPGIVMAILAAERSAETSFLLVESDQRKATFLRTVNRELDLGLKVNAQRTESLDSLQADVISARAFMPLDGILSHVYSHIAQNGQAILPKGRRAKAEIQQAKKTWRFDLKAIPSITDPEASILVIERIERV